MKSPTAYDLLQNVNRYGTELEQRLISQHFSALQQFILPHEKALAEKRIYLEIAIESELCLKVNILWAPLIDTSMLKASLGHIGPLKSTINAIHKKRLRYHYGIKLIPDTVEYEIYAYETSDNFLRKHVYHDKNIESLTFQPDPALYGINNLGDFTTYSTHLDEHLLGKVSEITQLNFQEKDVTLKGLIQAIPDGSEWRVGKSFLQVSPMPSDIFDVFLRCFNFPYFDYLHEKEIKRNAMNFAADDNKVVLYATRHSNWKEKKKHPGDKS